MPTVLRRRWQAIQLSRSCSAVQFSRSCPAIQLSRRRPAVQLPACRRCSIRSNHRPLQVCAKRVVRTNEEPVRLTSTVHRRGFAQQRRARCSCRRIQSPATARCPGASAVQRSAGAAGSLRGELRWSWRHQGMGGSTCSATSAANASAASVAHTSRLGDAFLGSGI